MRLGGSASPMGVQCPAHPFPALGHRLVGQAHDGEGRMPELICTWTSTARASMPSNATVVTRANMSEPPFGCRGQCYRSVYVHARTLGEQTGGLPNSP